MNIPLWKPEIRWINALGLSAPVSTGLRTQTETLFSLATTKGKAGMRLALGIKTASFIKSSSDGKPCFSGYKSLAFPYLCAAIAAHSKASHDILIDLLKGDFNWVNRFLPINLQAGHSVDLLPKKMPPTRWRLLHELAGSFGQTGTEYALRMFVKPFLLGESPHCECNPYFFTMFLDESYARRDHVPAQMNVALAKAEFSPFVSLAGATRAGAGSAPVLGPSAPSSGGPILGI